MSTARRSLREDSGGRRKSSGQEKSDTEKGGSSAASPASSGSSSGPPSGIRTRLSTGTLFMNGTSTVRDLSQRPPDSDDAALKEKETSTALNKKRQANEAAALPPPKRQKIGRNAGTGEDNQNDYFCWICHKDGPTACCEVCPRIFHTRCLNIQGALSSNWVCPECEKIMRAECVDTRSRAMSLISLDTLCTLLQFALQRMHHMNSDPFCKPVDLTQNPYYTEYIFHPMDLSTLEKNIKKKMYGCTEAFLADAKWILHNCIIYNGTQDRLTSAAKTIIKICRHEMSEIEVCPDCYMSSCDQEEAYWFCKPCRNPHPLVWAKLKGYPYWPAKALREVDGQVDVRFFGAHDRSWITSTSIFLLSREVPTPIKKGRGGFKDAMKELDVHIKKLKEQFGSFEYAPPRLPYAHKDRFKHVRIGGKNTALGKGKRLQKDDIKQETSSTGVTSPSKTPMLRRVEGRVMGGDRISVTTKTATAVKSKYGNLQLSGKRPASVLHSSTEGRSPLATTASPPRPAEAGITAATASAATAASGEEATKPTPSGVFTASREMEIRECYVPITRVPFQAKPLSMQSVKPASSSSSRLTRLSATSVVEKLQDRIIRMSQSFEEPVSSEPPLKIPRIKMEPLSSENESEAEKDGNSGTAAVKDVDAGLSVPSSSKVAAAAVDSAKDSSPVMDVDPHVQHAPLHENESQAQFHSSVASPSAVHATASALPASTTPLTSSTTASLTPVEASLATSPVTTPSASTLPMGKQAVDHSTAAVEEPSAKDVPSSATSLLKLVSKSVPEKKTEAEIPTGLSAEETCGGDSELTAVTGEDEAPKPVVDVLEVVTADAAEKSEAAEREEEGGSKDAGEEDAEKEEVLGLVISSVSSQSLDEAIAQDQEKDATTALESSKKSEEAPHVVLQKDDDVADSEKPATVGRSQMEGPKGVLGEGPAGVEDHSEDPSEVREFSAELDKDEEETAPSGSLQISRSSYQSTLSQTIASCRAKLGLSSDDELELSLEEPSEEDVDEEMSSPDEKIPEAEPTPGATEEVPASQSVGETGEVEALEVTASVEEISLLQVSADVSAAPNVDPSGAEPSHVTESKDAGAEAAEGDGTPTEVDPKEEVPSSLGRVEPGSVCSLASEPGDEEHLVLPEPANVDESDKPGGGSPKSLSLEGERAVEPNGEEALTSSGKPEEPQPDLSAEDQVEETSPVEEKTAVEVRKETEMDVSSENVDKSTASHGDENEKQTLTETASDKDAMSSGVTKSSDDSETVPHPASDKDAAADRVALPEKPSTSSESPTSEAALTVPGTSPVAPVTDRSPAGGARDSEGVSLEVDVKAAPADLVSDVVIVKEIPAPHRKKVKEDSSLRDRPRSTSDRSQAALDSSDAMKLPWTPKPPAKPASTMVASRGNTVPTVSRNFGAVTSQSLGAPGMPALGNKTEMRGGTGTRYPSMSLPTRNADHPMQNANDNRGRGVHHATSMMTILPSTTSTLDSRSRASSMDSATILKSMADLAKQTSSTQPERSRMEPCLPPEYSAMLNGTGFVCKYTAESARAMEKILSDMFQEVMAKNLPLQMEHFNKEMHRVRQIHVQEMEELKHNFTLTMMEARQCWNAELKKSLETLKIQHQQELEEAKRKQWCAQCGMEAMYYCCWNTSYCSEDCQRAHWPTHVATCEQAQSQSGQGSIVAMDTSQSAADSSTEVGGGGSSQPDSTHTPTGGQPATLSSATVDWLEKEEAMAAKSTFNLVPPKASQSGPAVSMVTGNAVYLQGGSQPVQVQYLPPTVQTFAAPPTHQVRIPFQTAPMGPGGIMQAGPLLQPPASTPSTLMYPVLRPPSAQPLPHGAAPPGQVLFSPGPPHPQGLAQQQVTLVPRQPAFSNIHYRPAF